MARRSAATSWSAASGYDTVRADDTTVTTGLRLNIFREGTGFTPDVNMVAFTSAAIGVERVIGNAGNDVIDASRLATDAGIAVEGLAGDDMFTSGAGADWFNGGADSDTAIYLDARENFEIASIPRGANGFRITDLRTGVSDIVRDVETVKFGTGAAEVIVDLTRPLSQASIIGTEGDDTLVGTTADNTIDALGGNDVIDGRGGTDTVNGGAGNDRILIGGQVLETGLDIVDGGADTDTIDFSGLDGSVNISLASGGFGMTAADGLSAAGGSPRLTNLENVVGSAYGDTIEGDGGANVLTGGLGADTLTAGAGQDTLIVDNADTRRWRRGQRRGLRRRQHGGGRLPLQCGGHRRRERLRRHRQRCRRRERPVGVESFHPDLGQCRRRYAHRRRRHRVARWWRGRRHGGVRGQPSRLHRGAAEHQRRQRLDRLDDHHPHRHRSDRLDDRGREAAVRRCNDRGDAAAVAGGNRGRRRDRGQRCGRGRLRACRRRSALGRHRQRHPGGRRRRRRADRRGGHRPPLRRQCRQPGRRRRRLRLCLCR